MHMFVRLRIPLNFAGVIPKTPHSLQRGEGSGVERSRVPSWLEPLFSSASSVPSAVKAFDFPSCTYVNLRVPVVDESSIRLRIPTELLHGVIPKTPRSLQRGEGSGVERFRVPSWLEPFAFRGSSLFCESRIDSGSHYTP